MKGQLSAEMLILIVVIIAIVGIAALQLIKTAKDAGSEINKSTKNLFGTVTEGTMSSQGEPCVDNDQCKDGLTCQNNVCS